MHCLDLVDLLDHVDGRCAHPSHFLFCLKWLQDHLEQQTPFVLIVFTLAQCQHILVDLCEESSVAMLMRHQLVEVFLEILGVDQGILGKSLG